ncbi:44166_t:CDS:2, partial [Gigaspora margarita]
MQGQKEAIKEEIIRNLTRKKTEKTLYEACEKNNTVQQVLTLWLDLSWNLFYENIWKPRYETVIAWEKSINTSSNTSSQEKKRWEMDQLQLDCLEKFITKE